MSPLRSLVALALHAALMAAAAPVLTGTIRALRARLLGLAPPSVLQPWRDLRRLLRKQPVLTEGASWLAEAAPCVAFAASAGASLLVPSFTLGMAGAPMADLIVIAGLLALARTALALAALDSGTAAGGIGARRTIGLAAFAEPALLLVVLVLALAAGSSNIDAIAATLPPAAGAPQAALVPAAAALVLVALTATAALPGEGPLDESGMGQGALVLEFSGRHLALIEASQALRLLLWFDLLSAVFVPFGMASPEAGLAGWPVGVAAWLARTLLLAIGLASWRAVRARPRLARTPGLLGMAAVLGLLAALVLFAAAGAA
jgi:formate hydrogenlyase subunit 4